MTDLLKEIQLLHYTKHLERSGAISGSILMITGGLIFFEGIKRIISHIYVRTAKYSVVSGRIIDAEAKVTHVKLSKRTEYFPTMEFDYGGRTYKIKSTVSFGEETMKAFRAASVKGQFEIRIPADNPFSAVPNYELDRKGKLFSGIYISVFGAIVTALGAFFILRTRP